MSDAAHLGSLFPCVMRSRRRALVVGAILGVSFTMSAACVAGCGGGSAPPPREVRVSSGGPAGIHKIRHVVVVLQENRSFDSYFGTYPRADGIPGLAGNPGTLPCSPDPMSHACVKPYHDPSDRNAGGPHDTLSGIRDIAGGKMNGFQRAAQKGRTGSARRTSRPRAAR